MQIFVTAPPCNLRHDEAWRCAFVSSQARHYNAYQLSHLGEGLCVSNPIAVFHFFCFSHNSLIGHYPKALEWRGHLWWHGSKHVLMSIEKDIAYEHLFKVTCSKILFYSQLFIVAKGGHKLMTFKQEAGGWGFIWNKTKKSWCCRKTDMKIQKSQS